MLWHKLIGGKIASGGGGSAFEPSQLASTVAWFDASDASTVTYNGSNQVSSWVDKISSTDATKTPSSDVTYDVSGGFISFSSSAGGLKNTSTRFGLGANPDIFVAAVVEVPNNSSNRLLTIGGLIQDGILAVQTDISWRFNNGNWIASEDVTLNTPELLVWQRFSGTNYGASTGYLNGTQLTQASTTNSGFSPGNTTTQFGIGTGFDSTADSAFVGDVYEIIICESSATPVREKIEGYLAHKYSLEGNLPVSHPYKSSPPTASTGFDISTAVYSQSFSVASQDTAPFGIAFNTDGTKMFIVGASNDNVYEYTLSTGFDVSTASYSQSFSVSAQLGNSKGIAFNTDGTKMFVVGGNDAYEYDLGTGFDVSTASFSQDIILQSINSQDIAFNSDGTKMFTIHSSEDVDEYDLSSGFDLSTASYSQSFSVTSEDLNPEGLAFNPDGTKMFVVGGDGDDVNEYTLGTGFDVSTASYSQNFSVASQDTLPRAIAFNTDGTKMFIVGASVDAVYEYDL